jgi:hypothetical protein
VLSLIKLTRTLPAYPSVAEAMAATAAQPGLYPLTTTQAEIPSGY